MLNWERYRTMHGWSKEHSMLQAVEYSISELEAVSQSAQNKIDKMDPDTLDNHNITLLGDAYRDIQYIGKMLISTKETLEEYVNCRSDDNV